MKFGEFAALLGRNDRSVRVYVEGDITYSTIATDGRFGSQLKDFEITEISIVKETICLKLKEAGA